MDTIGSQLLHVNLSTESMKQPHKCKQALLLTPNDHDVVDAHKSDGKYVDDADDEENEEQVDKEAVREEEDCWMIMRKKSRYCDQLSINPCLNINFFTWITLLIAPLVST